MPKPVASSIGTRRSSSDSSTRAVIVLTRYTGNSRSRRAIAWRSAGTTVSGSPFVRSARMNPWLVDCDNGK